MDKQKRKDDFNFEQGSRRGLFKVFNKTDNEIILGENDKHLDFRISLFLEKKKDTIDRKKITISTTVKYNNRFGKLYFFPVKPFHKLIAPKMLKGCSLPYYMNPLGLHHIFDTGHHYGPGPWVSELSRPEWNPVYYHNADENGIGFDRTPSGSNATEQYSEPLRSQLNDPKTCPEKYLLWFHHLPWDYTLKNGHTLWDGIALEYLEGVDQVEDMILTWKSMQPYIVKEQHEEVSMLLRIQLKEAKWWRDACLLYFQTFSKKELLEAVEKPTQTLEHFKSLKFPFAPGTRPRWN